MVDFEQVATVCEATVCFYCAAKITKWLGLGPLYQLAMGIFAAGLFLV